MKNFLFINNDGRHSLSEGRNSGFGHGFVKLDEIKKEIKVVTPISACGDYLNDVVWSENTGKDISIYGLSYTKQDIFNNKKKLAYLASSILFINRTQNKYTCYDSDYAMLNSNYKNIEKFINIFEKKFNVKKKTKIFKIKENLYIFQFDLFWTQATYLISLYKFLSRVALYYDGNEDIINFIDKIKNSDTYIWKNIKSKVMDMLNGNIPKQDMSLVQYPHNLGIVSFEWPKKI